MASNEGFEAGDDNGTTVTNRTERRTPAHGENVPNEATTLAGLQTYFVDEKVFIPVVDKVKITLVYLKCGSQYADFRVNITLLV